MKGGENHRKADLIRVQASELRQGVAAVSLVGDVPRLTGPRHVIQRPHGLRRHLKHNVAQRAEDCHNQIPPST